MTNTTHRSVLVKGLNTRVKKRVKDHKKNTKKIKR